MANTSTLEAQFITCATIKVRGQRVRRYVVGEVEVKVNVLRPLLISNLLILSDVQSVFSKSAEFGHFNQYP
jgi:hypothetical protein